MRCLPPSPPPDYDRFARTYRVLEYAAFGPALMRARTAHLGALPGPPARALLLGEGDGRFLRAARERWPGCAFTVADCSPAMLAAARRRAGAGAAAWTEADARAFLIRTPTASFDLVTTHFLFDCVPDAGHPALVSGLTRILAPGGVWLYSDFASPEPGGPATRNLARHSCLRALFASLGRATGHPNRSFTPPHGVAARAGLTPLAGSSHAFGLVESRAFQKP